MTTPDTTTVKVYELANGDVEFVMPGGNRYLGSRVQAIQALAQFVNQLPADAVGVPQTMALIHKLEALEVTA